MANENSTLGSLIRLLRQQNGWTLRQMSEKVGIPLSTLAKVEADKLSLTYEKLQQFTSRLGMSMAEFLGQAEATQVSAKPQIVTARKSVTSKDNSIQIATPNYDYQYLCADLSERRMVPIIVRIRSHDLGEFGEPAKHRGEEFIYVLEGSIEVHMQFYRSVILKPGEGIYLDSSMGHAYTAKNCDEAVVLAVCSGEDVNLAGELISLAESEARQVA
jgi:transcriptional regulator with XRE-family HTH domain